MGAEKSRSLSGIAVRDEAKKIRPDARPQARENRRRIRWNTNTLRIFSGRERRRWSWIDRRSRMVNVGQVPSQGQYLLPRLVRSGCLLRIGSQEVILRRDLREQIGANLEDALDP